MLKFLNKLHKKILWIITDIKWKLYDKKTLSKYPDWKDDAYNLEEYKFIWGVKSWDELSTGDCNMFTMNDIDITYNRETKKYFLEVETIYQFDEGKIGEVKYLQGLLKAFTKFMEQNNYDINVPYELSWGQPKIDMVADSIPELYTSFRIFVEGYNAVYGVE